MAEFKYEVLATYAEQGNLKVRSVSFNDREPKFDVRHWNEKDGKETMGKGVTLTIEELQYLAEALPKVYAELTGGSAKKSTAKKKEKEEVAEQTEIELAVATDDDEEEESSELAESAQKLVSYIISKAPDSLKKVEVDDGLTYASEGHMICALKGTGAFESGKSGLKDMYGKMILDGLEKVKVNIKELRNATKLRLKSGTMYSFGAGYRLVNAEFIGKAVRAVGENATISTDEKNKEYVVQGNNGTVVVLPINKNSSAVGIVKPA